MKDTIVFMPGNVVGKELNNKDNLDIRQVLRWLPEEPNSSLSYSGTIFLRLMEYLPQLSAMLTLHSPLSSGNRHSRLWEWKRLWLRLATTKRMDRMNEKLGSLRLP